MNSIKNQLLPFERITKETHHYFFGYYDLQPWSKDANYHLCTGVNFFNRLQTGRDFAEVGMVRMYDYKFIPVAETSAWNFQQGAMLQWNPGKPDEEIIYNLRTGGEFKGIIKNIHTGKEKILSQPVANVSSNGRYALSINFSRMYDFRPGYGYAGIEDRFENEKYPDEDGIFLIDMQTGSSKLIISLMDIYKQHKDERGMLNKKILINHVSFNTDGTRFIFLVRYFPQGGEEWKTSIFTAQTDGRNIYCLYDYGYASHYYWRDPEHILIYADIARVGKSELYLLKDRTKYMETVDTGFFTSDGHCSYSPDRSMILYDSYPDSEGFRHLYLYDLIKRKGVTLVSLYSGPMTEIDIRCDLHPRWDRSGKAISFDSIYEGHRHIYWMELEGVDRLI